MMNIHEFIEGAEIRLIATPDKGWAFSHWSGDASGSENPITLIIKSDMDVKAHFVQRSYKVTITTDGKGSVNIDTTYFNAHEVKSRIASQTEPQFTAYNELIVDAANAQNFKPSVPSLMDIDNTDLTTVRNFLESHAVAAYCSALAWLYSGNTDYADKAIEIMTSFVTADTKFSTQEPSGWQETQLQLSSWFSRILYAAHILKDYPGYTGDFENWWRASVLPFTQAAMTKSNNWGDSGLFAVALAGMAFGDQSLLDSCHSRIDSFMTSSVKMANDTNGVYLPEEVTRNDGKTGITYTAYALTMLCQGVEILKACGRDRWHDTHTSGATFKGLIEYYFRWNELGEPFPWHEEPGTTTSRKNPYELANNNFFGEIQGLSDWLEANRPVKGRQGDDYITINKGDL